MIVKRKDVNEAVQRAYSTGFLEGTVLIIEAMSMALTHNRMTEKEVVDCLYHNPLFPAVLADSTLSNVEEVLKCLRAMKK